MTGAGSLLPPVYSEAWAKGKAEVSLGHQSRHMGEVWAKGTQNTIFLLTGRRMRVGKPTVSVVSTGKEEREKWNDKKRVENRKGSLRYPVFVKPVFIKDSKPLGKIGKVH
ncbi:hypothetical protein TNCV_4206811 [Trichonephila clavipes]|nr:hypothetical protein TNCV_4206811 [Trichonephila clavipes]